MTRKITGGVFLSLDGVMQAPGGPTEDYTGGFEQGGWMFKIWDEGIEPAIGALFSGGYDLLLGRRTYDIFAAYWPYAEGDNKPMGDAFDRANKYVLTHGDQPLEWQNSHRLTSIEEVAALKQTDGSRLVIQGSSTLYPGLLAAGLIDELRRDDFPGDARRGKAPVWRRHAGRDAHHDRSLRHRQGHRHCDLSTRRRSATLPGRRPDPKHQRSRGTPPTRHAGRHMVMLALYGHKFSSYTWKALIALYANETPFEFREVMPGEQYSFRISTRRANSPC